MNTSTVPGRRQAHPLALSTARLAAVQALYQMDITATGLNDIIEEFVVYRLGREMDGTIPAQANQGHFEAIVSGVTHEQTAVDGAIHKALAHGWSLQRIDSILRAILRAGAYELMYMNHIPAAVVINEYMNVAHAFFDKEHTTAVNGILDSLGRAARPDQMRGGGDEA